MKRLAVLLLVASPLAAQVRPIPVPDSLAPGIIGHRGHVSGPVFVAASADGSQLVSAELEGNVIVWDGDGEKPRRILDFDTNITALAVSADGRRYAVAGWRPRGEGATFKMEHTVRVVDIDAQQAALTFEAPVGQLRFSPDGRTLVAALQASPVTKAPAGLVAWDLVGGTELARVLTDERGYTSILGYTRDGRDLLAVVCCAAHTVTAFPASLIGEPRVVMTLADYAVGDVNPAGDLLAITKGDSVALVSISNGAITGTLQGRPMPVRRLAFSADGRHLTAYVANRPTQVPGNELVVWDVASLRTLHVGPTTSTSALRAVPKGIWMGSSDGSLRLVDVTQGTVIRTVAPEHTEHVRQLFYGRPDDAREATRWRLLGVGPVVRDTSPPEHFPPVKAAGDNEYWTIDIDIENDSWTQARLWSPSLVTNVNGQPGAGGILLMRRKGNEGYPLVYLNPKGGGAISLSMSAASRGRGQSLGVQIELKPHERVRASLVFVVPKKAKETDLGLFFLEGQLITLRAAATP